MRLRRALTFVVVMSLSAALVAPGALAKQPDKLVPLKGNFAGADVEFSGNFSHLGDFDGLFGVPTVWTAANGRDTVENVTTFFEIDFLNPVAPGVFPYEQTIAITGGTGRFVCAFGGGDISGTINLAGEYDGYLDGMISQPDKKRTC